MDKIACIQRWKYGILTLIIYSKSVTKWLSTTIHIGNISIIYVCIYIYIPLIRTIGINHSQILPPAPHLQNTAIKMHYISLTHCGRIPCIRVIKQVYHWLKMDCCLFGVRPFPTKTCLLFNRQLETHFPWGFLPSCAIHTGQQNIGYDTMRQFFMKSCIVLASLISASRPSQTISHA